MNHQHMREIIDRILSSCALFGVLSLVFLIILCSLPSLEESHSSIGSRLKSARLSAPQTDQRFLSLLLRSPLLLESRLLLLLSSAAPSFSSVRSFAISSASCMAASSASGVSSIVSRDEMEGERDRREVGVDGILEAELKEYPGYGSLA
jgi:hypothetical protein